MSEAIAAESSPLWSITIEPGSADLDAHGAAVLRDIHELGLPHVERAASSRLFLLQGGLPGEVVEQISRELLADPITEVFTFSRGGNRDATDGGFDTCVEVHLKGGVMDPVAASTLAILREMNMPTEGLGIATGRMYRFKGVRSREELELIARRLLANDCIEDVYLTGFGRHDPRPSRLPVAPSRPFEIRRIEIRQLDDHALQRLSREAHLFLSVEEMRTIREYYRSQGRDPTDVELEMLAQTWSEHCVHKTLKSKVVYRGKPFPSTTGVKQTRLDEDRVEVHYDNLLADTVARATRELMETGRVTWCLSVFEDNAGVIEFDRQFGVAFKVETHNHPSAIEPYGGAATGAGGCIRDVMGCGLGAKPIANTDVFCVASPDYPIADLPKGVLHPRRILKGVVAGVRDYGNRMGIPTVNGAVLFDDRYLGNPLVFCGCVGLMPRHCVHKRPRGGDLIVVIGGRTGRDGIHGATFSSAELTDTHADEFSHAVQIGDAITEKRVLDAMLQARDHADGCLYTATTDCGAGGLSSAVGEMGAELGAEVDLEKVPLKYAGLRYDEIWISEAQERMVLAVPPENWERLRVICEAEAVEATVIGRFRGDGHLVIRYLNQVVGQLQMHFLHKGNPRTRKDAEWTNGAASEPGLTPAGSVRDVLMARLAALNTASKEWIIRQYDHEVQGGSVVKPLTGPGEGPSDAAVLRPRLDSDRGIVIANGICHELSDVDPYWMAVAAIDEAIRNVVSVGGDPDRTAILDNFCWGNCENPETMGALVRACQGCYDAAVAYGTPFISGKDSLNNEFAVDESDVRSLARRIRLHNKRIRIPGTLLISAISVVEDARQCVTMDAKPGDGEPGVFLFIGLKARTWQEASIAHAAALHRAVAGVIRGGDVSAAHDCGSEGILPALAEMAFAGRCGIDCADLGEPFAGVPCGYILQVTETKVAKIMAAAERLAGVTVFEAGRTRGDGILAGTGFEIDLDSLSKAWRSPLAW